VNEVFTGINPTQATRHKYSESLYLCYKRSIPGWRYKNFLSYAIHKSLFLINFRSNSFPMKTKHFHLFFFLATGFIMLFLVMIASAQVSVNADNSPPDPSAGLDVKFIDKGALLPRMTMAQRDAIVNPANGLIIICTDCGAGGMMNIYLNGSWKVTSLTPCTPTAPTAGPQVALDTRITWNWNTVTGAAGYKWNTINDYGTAADMGYSTSKTETGLTCNTSYTRYAWSYNGCGNSTPVSLIKSTLACFICGSSITVNHVAGDVAPVTKTVTYGTVTNVPGEPTKCWITRNLGASQQATAKDDATEASAGWYWQFNLRQGYKHDGTTRTPNTAWIYPNSGNSDWQSANDPCTIELGNVWRIPTLNELANLQNGNWGDWIGPYNSLLKIHVAGDLAYSNGILENRGLYGFYRSSTLSGVSVGGWILHISSGSCKMIYGHNANGFPLRCVKE
jgi:hypothetical protein